MFLHAGEAVVVAVVGVMMLILLNSPVDSGACADFRTQCGGKVRPFKPSPFNSGGKNTKVMHSLLFLQPLAL